MGQLRYLNLSEVFPNPDQPRKEFRREPLEELAGSIKTYGVQEPIKVTPRSWPPRLTGEGVGGEGSESVGVKGYMIVMGERRYRASILAGMETIPAIVEDLTDEAVDRLALIENLQREDLNIIEEARAFQRLLDKGETVESLAGVLVYKQPWRITDRTALLKLAPEYQDLVVKGHLGNSQAYEMSRVDGAEQMIVFRKIADGTLNTYEKLRAFVNGLVDSRAEVPLFDITPLTEKERAVLTSYEGVMDRIVAFLNRSFKDNELVVLKKVLSGNRAENIDKIDHIIRHLQKIKSALVRDEVQLEAFREKSTAA